MPLTLTVPEQELFDDRTGRFIQTKKTVLQLEHSLLSIRKWESKWHKPYLSKMRKTDAETIDYLRCMCLTKDVGQNVFYALASDPKLMKQIMDYINDPMTATTLHRRGNQTPSKDIITSVLVYFWMSNYGIPFECERWHFNYLMALIETAAIKNNPPKKGKFSSSMAKERSALNAQRRAKYNSLG